MKKITENIQKLKEVVIILPVLLRSSFSELQKNDPLRLAGATAFFTTFALPPILIILIQLFGLFFNEQTIRRELLRRVGGMISKNSALQIRDVLENMNTMSRHWYVTLLGFIFLLFVATSLFSVIKNSLNQIWNIRVVSKPGFIFTLRLRARALGIILLAGLLFAAGLIIEAIQAVLGDYLSFILPEADSLFGSALNEFFFIVIVTIWFSMLFRYLTDGQPAWKVAWAGGFFTGILFALGKTVLKSMLTISNIGIIYGASGSIVLILLFVFYSAMIFYFGGCFVKALSDKLNCPIETHQKAFHYEVHEIVKKS